MNMQSQIEGKLKKYFSPSYLEVVNESYKHSGHAGDDGSGESHFSVTMHSDKFDGMTHILKHREVHDVLFEELKTIHALSLRLK